MKRSGTLRLTGDASTHYEFLKYSGDNFLPSNIFDILQKFWISAEKRLDVEDIRMMKDYVILNSDGQQVDRYILPKEEDFKTFDGFYNLVIELMDALDDWLEENDASDMKFRSGYSIKTGNS